MTPFKKNNQTKLKKNLFLFILLHFLLINNTFSQGKLTIKGIISYKNKPINNVLIKVQKNGEEVINTINEPNGKFKIEIESGFDNTYQVSFFKENYTPNTFLFYTEIKDEKLRKKNYDFEMFIELLPIFENVDYSIFQEPIGKIGFDSFEKDFMLDLEFTNQKIDKMLAIQKDVDIRVKNTAAYKLEISKADSLYALNDLINAKNSYRIASRLIPSEKYPKQKISEINDILAQQAKKKKYDEIIAQADNNFVSKIYAEAKKLYTEASTIMPNESYPIEKIKEIDEILAKIENDKRKFIELVSEGDRYFNTGAYSNALDSYNKAKEIIPEDASLIAKIEKTNEKLLSLTAKEKNYAIILGRADSALFNQNYTLALNLFQKATQIKPEEEYPKNKINEINKILTEIKQKNIEYNNVITLAEKNFKSRLYVEAKNFFEKAQQLKPEEKLPKQRIIQIDSILTLKKNIEEQYANSISTADTKFAEKQYEEAKFFYEKSLEIKPNESYPKNKIKEIDNILAEIKTKEYTYTKLISEADIAFASKNWSIAKNTYQKALTLKPDENYPKTKVTLIDSILNEQIQKEKAYKTAIQLADNYYIQKKYEEAINEYKNATKIKPDETYPINKINEIEALLIEQKNRDEVYNKELTTAEIALNNKNYTIAKMHFQKALAIKPQELYPKNKINEIDKILSELKNREENYNKAIAEAEAYFKNHNYEKSKESWTKALTFKPDDSLSKSKIIELDKLISEIKTKKEQYNQTIVQAEKEFNSGEFLKARNTYQIAANILPDEQLPKSKIKEIDLILNELEKKSKKENYEKFIAEGDELISKEPTKALQAYQKALEIFPDDKVATEKISKTQQLIEELEKKRINKEYKETLAEADLLFSLKQYEKALEYYEKASKIKPEELHPRNRINEINIIFEEQRKIQNEQYALAIKEGDNHFNNGLYIAAKNSYEKALQIKPEEDYPRNKINELLPLIQRNKEQAQNLIKDADKSFAKKHYEDALDKYQRSFKLNPENLYAKNKIDECTSIIAELKRKRNEYEKAITEADKLFNMKKYTEAKSQYMVATTILPEEIYPHKQIEKINKILDAINPYLNAIADADLLFKNKEYEKAIQAYEKASKLKPDESYPQKKIQECKKLIEMKNIVEKAYKDGYYIVFSGNEKIKNNNEKKFTMYPFDQKMENSIIKIKVKNLSNQNINTIINYGYGETKNGGTYVDFIKSSEIKEYSINLSSQQKWRVGPNDWLAIYPMGGDIEIIEIKIVF